jgi:UDP-glucose/GDP-mannose dehydrogenase family, NAD binding domain
MRVAMIGSGYVGLVSGACFADFGHQVTCVDKDAAKIARLRGGDIPIFEPDLDRLVAANMREKRLDFTTDLPGPVAEAGRTSRASPITASAGRIAGGSNMASTLQSKSSPPSLTPGSISWQQCQANDVQGQKRMRTPILSHRRLFLAADHRARHVASAGESTG